MRALALTGDVAQRVAAALAWRLLGLLLSRPRPGWVEEVTSLAAEVAGDTPLRDAALAARGATEGDYHALLGAGGPASPREVAHAGFADPGRILADLAAWYGAFGFAPRSEEPHDHVAVECDFVSYLFLKEAYALARGHGDSAAVTAEARTRFLAEHAAVAGRGFVRRLPDAAPAYLRAAADLLAGRLPETPRASGSEAAPEDGPDELCCGSVGSSIDP